MGKFKDLTGQRFGKLTVVKRVENKIVSNSNQYAQWLCKCDCGNEIVATGVYLRTGNIKSCGCSKFYPTYIDLTGQKFGEWTVLKRSDLKTPGKTWWTCKCSCGVVKDVDAALLKNGRSKSCGHLHLTKGNYSKERIYNVWRNMIARCNNPKAAHYDSYDGRGISVCEEWKDFLTFRDWAYANGYDKDAPIKACTIDRIDTTGNYCPENCRWTDWNTQANNRTACKYITIDGVTHDISEWGHIMGISKSTIRGRLKTGWSEKDAIMTPVWGKRKGA